MNTFQFIGWKSYAVGVLCIVIGAIALVRGNLGDGLKGILAGLAIISLRDAVTKILRTVEENRRAMDNVRAALDSIYNKIVPR